jgi:hypothetical protein
LLWEEVSGIGRLTSLILFLRSLRGTNIRALELVMRKRSIAGKVMVPLVYPRIPEARHSRLGGVLLVEPTGLRPKGCVHDIHSISFAPVAKWYHTAVVSQKH